jgi:hypothetical protein
MDVAIEHSPLPVVVHDEAGIRHQPMVAPAMQNSIDFRDNS